MARWFVDRSAHRGIPSVSLRRLLPEATFAGVSDLVVSGVSADSRRIEPGELFIALRGRRHDGHDFVARAFESGASAAVVERACHEAGKLQVVVPDAGSAYARIAHALAGEPSGSLRVIGMLVPDGDEAAARFLLAILERSGRRVGWIAPSGWSDGVTLYPPRPSAPDAAEIASMLSRMVERGCEIAVVGLTPEALEQRAAEGLKLAAVLVADAAGVADDAEATAHRRRLHARLVRRVEPGGLVILDADDRGAALLAGTNLDSRAMTFGSSGAADVIGRLEATGADRSRLTLGPPTHRATALIRPLGSRAAAGALAAATAARGLGIGIDAAIEGLESVVSIPGHLEPARHPFEAGVRAPLFRLHAREAADLTRAVEALRESGRPRFHLIFEVGTARGRTEDVTLARAAECAGGQVVVTLDPGATQDVEARIDAMLAGFRRPGRVRVEPDPRAALRQTLALASHGDAVVVVRTGGTPSHRPAPDRRRPALDETSSDRASLDRRSA